MINLANNLNTVSLAEIGMVAFNNAKPTTTLWELTVKLKRFGRRNPCLKLLFEKETDYEKYHKYDHWYGLTIRIVYAMQDVSKFKL